MKRLAILPALLLALALLVTACGGGGQSNTGGETGTGGESGGETSGDSSAVKFGILLPATGDLGDLGGPMINAAQLAFQHVNDAGGILGGRPVEAVLRDNQTDEVVTRDAADQLANVEGVLAVIGAAGSGNSFAAIEVLKPAQVVQISPSSTAPGFTTYDDGGYFFRTAPSDSLQGAVMAQLVSSEGYRRAATLALNNDYGEGFKDVFIETFEAAGGEIVADVLYDPAGTTFTSEVTRIAEANPEVIILVGYPETGAAILREAYQQGLMDGTVWILSEGLQSSELAENVGTKADGSYIIEGVRGTQPKSVGPAYDAFVSAFEEAYGSTPSGPFDAHTYDAAVIAALATEAAGTTDGAAIKDVVAAVSAPPGETCMSVAECLELLRQGKEINYEGASGTVDMDEVGDVLAEYEVWQIQADGSVAIIGDVKAE